MAIESAELKYYLTGTATSDGQAASTPAASLGGFRSSSEITSDTDNNLFDDVSGAEAAAGRVEYRCVCIKNTDVALDLTDAVIYLSDDDIGGSNTVAFAIEVPTTSELTGSCQTIANETTVPATINSGNVSDWSTVTSYGTGLGLDINAHDADLGSEELVFVWIRRTIAVGATAASAIKLGIKIEGDTAA